MIRIKNGYVSIIDIIREEGNRKSPHKVWSRLKDKNPELRKLETKMLMDSKIGKGNLETPVCLQKDKEFILSHLPEKFDPHKSPESAVRKILARQVKGKIEVECSFGRVDVVTDSHIIEVKEGKFWKNAIGQILSYILDFPNHQLRVHLFNYTSNQVRLANKVCQAYNISLTLHQ